METDYEAAWRDFKAAICEKRSHGQTELLAQMARLEVEHEANSGRASLPSRPTGPSPTERRRNGAVARV